MCSFPCVSSRPGQILRSTYPRQKNVIDQICSKAEPPELVGKVDGVLRQEGADVFPAQFGTLWRLLLRPVFIVMARVALEGLWDSFALLVVTTKALLSALTWISKLLEFGLVKKSFPMVYQLYTC